jgi:hypothetical protein
VLAVRQQLRCLARLGRAVCKRLPLVVLAFRYDGIGSAADQVTPGMLLAALAGLLLYAAAAWLLWRAALTAFQRRG